ncbi:MAG TPA: Bug family tripartite tricarboxylate transporter substrate binding protein [Ramlibacter sp.]|nr:Bug family tripartite tricarboxylate transporter substrate binding protein [Ramlibacter sp.]
MNRRDAAAALVALPASFAHAQRGQPPVHIVVGYAPGGATDRVARIIADALQAKIGRSVIVDNRAGAGGRLAAQFVKASPPGADVLMVANPAVMVVAPLVFKDSGYDPHRDFVPVSHVNDYEFGIAVGPAVPVRELTHLLAWLRANPEKANFGVPATGSLPHFFALMLGQKAGVRAEVVGYRGSGPLLTDLIGGQLPVAVDTFDTLLPQHRGGKIRVLAVSGAKRSPLAADIPTFREAGLDIVATGWNAIFAPASMPAAKVDAFAVAIREVMLDPRTQQRFVDANMQPVVSTRAQTAAMLQAFERQWAPVVRKSGYQP